MDKPFKFKESYSAQDLVEIMAVLRGENGCPWDREQTHKSIRKNFIEETYEVLEAIDKDDSGLLCEELGDVLLQIVFHSRMAEEYGRFDFDDVCDGICKKLIHRHPHIFSDVKVKDAAQVLDNWDNIKKEQKGQTTAYETLISVPKVLPALMRSTKVQSRAAKSGFDYPDINWALQDLESEVVELREAIVSLDTQNITEELGDLIFSAVNVARFSGVDAEEALSLSCEKFIHRFRIVEDIAAQRNIDMKNTDIHILNQLWIEAKGNKSEF